VDMPPEQPTAAAETKPAVFRFAPFEWAEAEIPKRHWIARGFMMRGAVSLVGGPGSAGKSSLMVALTTALALGRDYGRFSPENRRPYKVMSVNMEDDEDEQNRRYSAVLRQFDGTPRDLGRNLMRLHPEGIGTLMQQDQNSGRITFTEAWHQLEDILAEQRPDVLILDPLVELHTAEENDNTALRLVIAHLRTLAKRWDCAVVLIHHTRKGSIAGDPDSLRGASSIVGACRVVLTVTPMSDAEALELNIAPDLRRRFFRVDSAKQNYAPSSEAAWHELFEYELDNGDLVAAALPWNPTPVVVTPDMLLTAVTALRRGVNGEPCSESPNASASYQKAFAGADIPKAAWRQCLDALKQTGDADIRPWRDPVARKTFKRVWTPHNKFDGWAE
jgi:hypothetical protein